VHYNPVMLGPLVRPSRCFRVKASLLLAVFLAAGTSLPSLDAVLYHSQGSDIERWQSHVEPAGGCLNHLEHCTLGRTATGSEAVAHLSGEPRVQPAEPDIPQPLPASPHISTDRGATARPRAPPILRPV
jgi:hypothetical protein